MQKRKANIFLWVMVALAGITMSGCLKSSDPQPQPAQSYISIMQLATMPPAPAVDIYFNDKKVSSNAFTPGAVSAMYSPVDKGIFSVTFKKAGGDSIVASIPVDQYDSLGFYTVMVYNRPDGSASALRIEDDFSDLTLDKPYFRFFHASPTIADLGPVDLYIGNNKVSSQRMLADNESGPYYNEFQASTVGYHKIQVKLSRNDSLLVESATDVNMLAGNAYTIYLAGNKGGTGANALTIGALRAAN